jgi:hypothetical protein
MWTDRLAVGLDTLSLAVDRYAARLKTNLGNSSLQLDGILFLGEGVERLYCKRPILCLASSKILTPHPLTARRVCPPPPLVRGEDTLGEWGGGGGSTFGKTPDTVLYSTYVSTLWVRVKCLLVSNLLERYEIFIQD